MCNTVPSSMPWITLHKYELNDALHILIEISQS